MVDLDKIRNMNDDELKLYLTKLARKKHDKCSICGKPCTKSAKIYNAEVLQTKSLAGGICDKHYEELLAFLDVLPIVWDE